MEDNYNEKIDPYLDGVLNAEEKAAFEKSMEQDLQLEEEVRQNLLLREVVEAGYQEKMRSDIRRWKGEAGQSGTQKVTNLRKLGYRLAAAASVVIILTASIFTLIVPQYSNNRIAARYYEPDEDLGSIRGAKDADILRQAFENYEQGNYTGAIPGFQRYPDNDKALYGLGLSFYQIKDYENAIETFKTLIERNNIEYTERAEFYLLLSYLYTDQTGPEFQQLLDKMIEEEGYYAGQAEGVKKKLESFWRSLR
jgi:TolA-binding protein